MPFICQCTYYKIKKFKATICTFIYFKLLVYSIKSIIMYMYVCINMKRQNKYFYVAYVKINSKDWLNPYNRNISQFYQTTCHENV